MLNSDVHAPKKVIMVWGDYPIEEKHTPLRLDEFPEPRDESFQAWFQQGKNVQYLYSINPSPQPEVQAFWPTALDIMIRVDGGFANYEDGFMGLENTFKNKELILTRGDISKARCTYESAVLLAAGPSMNDCWDQISKDCLIVVCDVMLKKCLEKGITPHIVMSTERLGFSEEFFNDIPHDSLLVAPFVVDPKALHSWKGPINFVSRNDFLWRWCQLKKRKTIHPHASVIPNMIEVCGMLGIKNILLLGQDLTFQNGNSHADLGASVAEQKQQIEDAEKTLPRVLIPCHDGVMRESTPIWVIMKEAISHAVSSWHISAASASPTGAKIKGVPCVEPMKWYEENPMGGEFQFKEKNQYEEIDREAWNKKEERTLQYFHRIMNNIGSHDLYGLVFDPNMHLLTAALIRDYVTYLHENFQAENQLQAFEAKHKFIQVVLKAIRQVGKIL